MEVWIEIDLARQVEVLRALRQLGFIKKYGGDEASGTGATGLGIFFGHLDQAKHDEARRIEGVRKLGHEGLSRAGSAPATGAQGSAESQHRSPPNPHRRRRRRR